MVVLTAGRRSSSSQNPENETRRAEATGTRYPRRPKSNANTLKTTIMKISNVCKYLLAAFIGIAALTGCKDKGEETGNLVAYFELRDSDGAVSGTQKFAFGNAVTYTVNAKNATVKSVQAPSGWTAVVNDAATSCVVTAPAENDTSAAKEGDIVFNLESPKISLTEYKMSVEVSMTPSVTPGAAGRFKFGVAQDVSFTQVNVARIEATDKPGGWNATADLTANKITITPPANMEAGEVGSGTFTFKAWETSEDDDMTATFDIDVRLDGILDVADQQALRVDYAAYIMAVKAFASGEGTQADIDTAESKFDKYMQNGEFALIADIGPVTQDCCFSGNANIGTTVANAYAFKHTFNGHGHTVTLALDTGEYIVGGLFQCVAYPGEVKNLTVDGTFRSSPTLSNAYMISGGVAGVSDGGKFTNVATDIAYTFTTVHTNPYTNYHAFGSIAGKTNNQNNLAAENTTSYFTDCHSKGRMNLAEGGSPHLVGGILGAVNANSLAEFVRCTNSGSFDYAIPEGSSSGTNRYFGGIIGGSGANGVAVKVTDCTNTGNITCNADGREARMQVGGIHGYSGGGTYTNCKNTGNIYHSSANMSGTSVIYDRLGGIIGHAHGNNAAALVIDNCTNEGSVSTRSNWTGGIIGTVENCTSTTIKGCTNKGAISNNSTTTNSYYLSGICGLISNGTLAANGATIFENCINEGKISGNVSATAAGMLNRSNREVTFKNCHNKGAMDITTLLTGKSPLYVASGTAEGWLPLVAGIAVVGIAVDYANSGIVGNFEGCTNTGTIKAEVFKDHCVQNIWIAAPIHRNDVPDETDTSMITITADAGTTTAQADRSLITATIKTVAP